MKSLSRFLGGSPKPGLHLAAFGKHPGWNDHLDDLGLDTDALVEAKRLLYMQGISQNIDSGAWEKLEPQTENPPRSDEESSIATLAAPRTITRLDLFCHDFLWAMPPTLLAGRLWASTDGKGRDKYPMVLCAQIDGLPDRFATQVALPFLAQVHQQCAVSTSADTVRQIVADQRENLRALAKEPPAPEPLSARQVAAVANHKDMHGYREGFHRICYQFHRGMMAYHTDHPKNAVPHPEHLRLPRCGMTPKDALLFWYRFALTFVDASTPMLLVAPDQGRMARWVDLIVGEPTPANFFCIKAGTKSLPYTSDIPYSLELPFIRAIDAHIAPFENASDATPFPPWPDFS